MSLATDSQPAGMSPPPKWPIWLAAGCLAAAAIPFLMHGISLWRDDDLARAAVERFFRLVAEGRRADALDCLTDEYRSSLRGQLKSSPELPWTETPGVSIHVQSVELNSDRAVVRASLGKDGFTLNPTVHLFRTDQGDWKIVQIEGGGVDPRWIRRQEREAREEQEKLAEELAEKLQVPSPEQSERR